jgi:hypothetical protein
MADATTQLADLDFVITTRLDKGTIRARRIVSGRHQDTKIDLKYEGGHATVSVYTAPTGSEAWKHEQTKDTGTDLAYAVRTCRAAITVAKSR